MEKFGIFELLDTLSALILPEAGPQPPDAGAPSADLSPNAADRAFAPPAYGSEPSMPPPGASALSSFLDKHDRTVKHIGAGDGGSSGSSGSSVGAGSSGSPTDGGNSADAETAKP